ncbi:MAG: RHS repeat-associated core domain-containing protein [bacterium]|nr:RHS repeat-associated core domain-containing protein [bacterium]
MGTSAYEVAYAYDDNGNRRSKVETKDSEPTVSTYYNYDIDDPAAYGTMQNRLMSTESFADAAPLETVTFEYDREGNVSHTVRRAADDATISGTRFAYDRPGRLWQVIGYEREEDVGAWYPISYNGEDYEVALTNAALSWDDAHAEAVRLGGHLAEVRPSVSGMFDWFVNTFRPETGEEARYWTSGVNITDYPECTDTPYWCWGWADEELETYWSWWVPEDYATCGPLPSWCSGSCVLGGWLTGQPDDGAPDCVEDGEEQRMQFVFNRGDHANSNGFADAVETEVRRALVVRLVSHTEQPAERTFAREFRYDGGRQRYLVRGLDPLTFDAVSEVWSDYLGDDVYADYEVGASGAVTERTSYLAGHWQTDAQTAASTFFHADHLGTTRALSDSAGALVPGSARLYTAFGEVVTPPTTEATRYGYAGAWGYEGGTELWGSSGTAPGILHVGARYYDPALGRFLQRDPIGIDGGLNVYAFVMNSPLAFVDPSGLSIDDPPGWDNPTIPGGIAPAKKCSKLGQDIKDGAKKVVDAAKRAWDTLKRLPPYAKGVPSSPVPADLAPGIGCALMGDAKRRHALKAHGDGLPDPNCPTCKALTPKSRKGDGW